MILHLKTLAVHVSGCYSALVPDGGVPFAVTLERTFDDLRTVLQNGDYECIRGPYHIGGYETFEIQVPGHDRVLFHIGNIEKNSEGCVLIAEGFNGSAISDSKGGFAEFMRVTAGLDKFTLRVSGR